MRNLRDSEHYIEIEEPDVEMGSSKDSPPSLARKSPEPSITSSTSSTTRSKHESYDLSGTTFLISSDGQIINLPIPSQSPYDPLNWSTKKRAFALFSIGFFSYTGTVVTQGTSNLVKGLAKDFPYEQIQPFTIETVIVAPTLFMGVGAFLWIPLSLALGRKRVFLLAAITLLIGTIIAGLSTNFFELLACVAALGFAQGFSLSVAFLMIIDLTFIHQRPSAIALVWSIAGACGVLSLALIPFITDHGMKWQRFYQFWTIPETIALLLSFFCYPETYFKRPTVAFDGRVIYQSATEKLTIYETERDNSDRISFISMNSNKDLPLVPTRSRFGTFVDQYWIPRNKSTSWSAMLNTYPQIFFCMINPLVFWVVLFTAINFGGMMYIGATFPIVLSTAPYNLPSNIIINVNNCAALGALLAYPAAGPLVSAFVKRASKRNRGVLEAEHYLVGYIFPMVSGVISTILYGLAVHNSWHYSVYFISYGFNSFSFTSLGIVNTLWVTEAFPRWAAAALCVVGGGSYLASCGMSLTVVPWLKAHGYLLVGIEFTALQAVVGLVVLPMAFWGKKARQTIHGRWVNRREGALRPQ